MPDESRDHVRQDLPGDDPGAVEALLTGGDPRSLRNADIVVDAASRQPERLEELVQCVFSAGEIVRMRASDALEKVCRAHPRLLQRFVPRLLGEMSRIEQASVQWHLAQILAEVPLDEGNRPRPSPFLSTTSTPPATGSSSIARLRPLPCSPGPALLSGRG